MESLYTSISSYYLPKEESFEMTSDTVLFGNRVFEKGVHSFQDFLDYTKSLFWFSYRKDFQPILPTNYTSDMGWGCMLRSGQMMLSQAFLRHYLGPKWESKSPEEFQRVANKILKMFEDVPTAPYSIHKIAQSGVRFHKNIGEWFAPSTVSQVLCDLTKIHQPDGLAIYVSNDQVLYRDEIFKLCRNRKTNAWKSVIILIPLRLGLDSINDVYYDNLLKTFNLPQSLGIIGGKPRAAMYFVGYQDQYLYYLDPHTVQPYQPISDEIPKSALDSFHCQNLGKMSISSLDPSLALGFYCSDRSDFEDFWRRVSRMNCEENALFTVADEAPEYRSVAKAKSLTLEEFEEDLVIL